MSDLIAGPAGGGARGGRGRPPSRAALPVLLLGALGAAALNAAVLVALFGGFGGDSNGGRAASGGDAGVAQAAASGLPARVLLVITLRGRGDGEIQIAPGGDLCSESCERRFDAGTPITIKADAGGGSVFKGWGGACDGAGSCTFVLDRQRSLTVTFALKPPRRPASDTPVDEDLPKTEEELDAELEAGPDGDCSDGRDNDRDGLVDTAQDPDCATGNIEAGDVVEPPPVTPAGDCADGRDNDGDGLTDAAQDPQCATGTSERAEARPKGQQRAPSECRDGKDNDADGLIDTAQDPGCIEDSTEA